LIHSHRVNDVSVPNFEFCDIVAECDVQGPVLGLLAQPGLVHSQLANVAAAPGVSLLNAHRRVTVLAIDELC